MAVNAKGVFLGTKHAIPAMRRAGGGSIVNISSTAGLVGSPYGSAAYTASKGAVRLFTKVTAMQHAKDKIRCNSVHPGPIDTPMIQESLAEYEAAGAGPMRWQDKSWMLDDEEAGQPFLRRARETGVRNVCVHKGISAGAATGWDGPSSPRDIGPAAQAFPDIQFLVYHSGYEPREGGQEEGPYAEEVAHYGTNRLIKSLKDAGLGPAGMSMPSWGPPGTW